LGTDPQLASESVQKMAEKIRLTLRETYDLGEMRYTSSACVGSAQFRGDEVSVDQILKDADAAMYAEKKNNA
jgi:GGDEF domain-containing protein